MLNIICHIPNTQVNQEQSPTYIQFANVLEVLVQGLHHVVDELEQGQLVQVAVNIQPDDEVKRGIPPVDHLILPMLQKRTLWPHTGFSDRHKHAIIQIVTYLVLRTGQAFADQFTLQSDALLHRKAIIVLGQARLSLLVHH